jgi:hypothetical protein
MGSRLIFIVNLGIFLSGDVSGEDVIEYENLRFRLNQELNMSSAENGITGIDDSFIDVCSFSEEQQGDSLAHRLKSEITQEPVDNMFESFESIIKNVTPPRGDVSGEDVIEYENLRFRSR